MIARFHSQRPGHWLVHPGDYQCLVTVPDAEHETATRLEASRMLQPPRDNQDADLYDACLNALFDDAYEAVEFVLCDSMEGIPEVEPDPLPWLAPALLPTNDNYAARRTTTT